jgi:hypothetical protein
MRDRWHASGPATPARRIGSWGDTSEPAGPSPSRSPATRRTPMMLAKTGLSRRSSGSTAVGTRRGMRQTSERQQVTVCTWSLADRTRGDTPRLAVPWSALAPVTGGKGFNGSAVALAPGGRSLLMVAGPQQLFAEVGVDGAPLLGGSIDRGTHPQPESLAFLPDGSLLVASEGGKGEAVLARPGGVRARSSRSPGLPRLLPATAPNLWRGFCLAHGSVSNCYGVASTVISFTDVSGEPGIG